jgi:putative Mn2+ efflux pump MntP
VTLLGDGGLFTILLIALGLSADCFAVALGASTSSTGHLRSRALRTALSFGLFQAVMPVLGWLAGRTIVDVIADFDHWVAFGLLAGVGGHMLWESFRSEHTENNNTDVTRGLLLLTLSLATSIDALAVGLSFAFIEEVNIVMASVIIGVVAFVATGVGFLAGRKAGELVGKRAETVGGLVLIGIGVRILLSHLL